MFCRKSSNKYKLKIPEGIDGCFKLENPFILMGMSNYKQKYAYQILLEQHWRQW